MNQQRGLLLELRDVKLDEGVEVPVVRKGSRRGLRARLPEAQQGPAEQPHWRAFNFEIPRALQNSFLQVVTLENSFDAFISEVEFSKQLYRFFLFVRALNLPAPNVKTMTELPAASVHQDSSEADLAQLLDAWSQGWKRKGRVRAVGPGAYEKYCTLALYALKTKVPN